MLFQVTAIILLLVLWVLFWKNVSAEAAGDPNESNRKR